MTQRVLVNTGKDHAACFLGNHEEKKSDSKYENVRHPEIKRTFGRCYVTADVYFILIFFGV